MVRGWSKIALALGGGAARGLAHIGVLQVLEEEQIPIHLITGTSIGALVGGVYARTLSARATREKFTAFARSREFRRSAFDFLRESRENRPGVLYNLKTLFKRGIFYGTSMTRTSFISAENFEHNINSLLDDVDFRDTGIAFAALAVCLSTGEEVVLREGSLRRAVKASCAIPGVLPPVEFDGRLLIDGGWLNKVPVLPAFRLGARAVIAVDISQDLEDTQAYRKGYDIMVRANAIRSVALKKLQSRFADVLIQPRVDHIHWADFSAVEEAVRLGEEAARQAIPAIRTLLRRRRWAAFLDPVRPCLCDRLLPPGAEGRGESPAGSL